MLAASTAFHFTPRGPWAREDTLLRLYKSFIHAARYLQKEQETEREESKSAQLCAEYDVCFVHFRDIEPCDGTEVLY